MRDTYCEDCNIQFYNLNKKVVTKEKNNMFKFDEVEAPAEEEKTEEVPAAE